jgi:DNA-directed RNA polymerase specialized sigma24 family protein
MSDASIYEELRWDLMRFATALVGPDEAADVVSAVVCRVISRRGGLASLSDPKPYLIRSIQNEARTLHRARVRRPVGQIAVADSPAVGLGNDELFQLVMDLPVRQRAALYLTSYEGYSPTETAELMGCRPATVRRYLHLARANLREALDDG